MEVKIVGSIHFKNRALSVYGNLDGPLFKVMDVAELLSYGDNNVWNLTSVCGGDERLVLPAIMGRRRRKITFVTEMGLYSVLAQSRKPIAWAWRRVIAEELIALRRSRRKNISGQLEDQDHRADTIYFNGENGMLMHSAIAPDGGAEQIPYEPRRHENRT